MLLTKAAYGLVQAPLQWYHSVCNTMNKLGYQRLVTELCCWIYVDDTGTVRSMIHGHVDDFVFGGDENCPIHKSLMSQLQAAFSWGTWEVKEFEQCGILVKQGDDFSITLSQQRFIEEIDEIPIQRDRSRQPQLPATDREKSCLRGVLGSLSWLCGQTCFLFSVDTNFLVSEIPVATVETVNKTNALVRAVRKWKSQEYKIHSFQPESDLTMVVWADAAFANRPNGKASTAGIFVGMSDAQFTQGQERDVSPIFWRSAVLWSEMSGRPLDPREPITDSRNLYDKLHRATVVIKGAEKRSDIEAISLRDHFHECQTRLFWVHGGAMIANSLTKVSEKHQAMMYVTLGFRYKVTYDELNRSEKVRRREGIGPLESAHNIH